MKDRLDTGADLVDFIGLVMMHLPCRLVALRKSLSMRILWTVGKRIFKPGDRGNGVSWCNGMVWICIAKSPQLKSLLGVISNPLTSNTTELSPNR